MTSIRDVTMLQTTSTLSKQICRIGRHNFSLYECVSHCSKLQIIVSVDLSSIIEDCKCVFIAADVVC